MAFSARTCTTLQVAFVALLCAVCVITEDVYTSEFAVHLRGGRSVADRLAAKYGYTNQGQIGELEDHYVFTHHGISKRSTVPSSGQHIDLANEPEVEWFEQQVSRTRVKRTGVNPFYFSDPFWHTEWYLDGNASSNSVQSASMNVQQAWSMGYTGKGIVVAILDDGLEHNHTDIEASYDADASYDFVSKDADPMPKYIERGEENMHGTRCAGEIVMQPNNSMCGVGVAYNASIGGIRMLDDMVTDMIEAKSVGFNIQHIDIYSASWGPDDGGYTVEGPGRLAKRTLEQGVTMGRGGKGSIYVWASGNGGIESDDCNADGYAASIHTLVVSSTTEHQTKPFYSEHCAASLASTFSSGDRFEKKVMTTDLHNTCEPNFTGTSASAPIAAGICALALEANGNLTWRDMQYLVVATSKRHQLEGDWTTNGAGYEVSHWFGFGLMDAGAMVERAQTWETLPKQYTCSKFADIRNQRYRFFQWRPANFESSLEVSQCREPSGRTIEHLEHVQLTLTLRARRRGQVKVRLISPAGTVSTLLSRRFNDLNRRGFTSWTLMSVHFWGENPLGTWKLEIGDGTDNRLSVTSVRLTLRGTTFLPKSLLTRNEIIAPEEQQLPLEETEEVGKGEVDAPPRPLVPRVVPRVVSVSHREGRAAEDDSSSWDSSWWWSSSDWVSYQDCHEECLYGCSGSTASDCYKCRHYKNRDSPGDCVETCPDGQYAPPELHIRCKRCNVHCKTCSGPSQENCLSCPDNKFLNDNNRCTERCESGYYPDHFFKMCRQCSPLCTSCEGNENQCTRCIQGAVLRGSQCITRCMDSEFMANEQCYPCHLSCYSCNGGTENDCTACYDDYVHMDMRCVQPNQCGDGYYIANSYDASSRQCLRCHSTCQNCRGPSFTDCIECRDNSFLVGGACLQTCENGKFLDDSGVCRSCGEGCTVCADERHCIQCEARKVLVEEDGGEKFVCKEGCPDGQYSMESECFACHSTCHSCHGGGIMDCTQCRQLGPSHKYLLEGACVSFCPRGYYESDFMDDYTCAECDESCRTCLGPGVRDCTQCEDGLTLDSATGACDEDEGLRCEAANCDDCVSGNSNACQRCLEGFYLDNTACGTVCPVGKFPESATRSCELCHPSCKSCEGQADTCISCDGEYFLDVYDDLCLTQCPDDMYAAEDKTCQDCNSKCLTCTGRGADQCTSCYEITEFLSGTQCVRDCPSGEYGDEYTGTCRSCHPSCVTCSGPGDHECDTCRANFNLDGGMCKSTCNERSYAEGSDCHACHDTCQTCTGPTNTDCLSCNYYNFLDGQHKCVTDCPELYYPDYESNVCRECDPSCKTCLDAGEDDCIECSDDTYMLLRNGQLCVETCPEGFYESTELHFNDCRQCSIECRDCHETYQNCISCHDGTYLYQQRCYSTCPSGYDEDVETNHCIQRERLCPLFCQTCDDWGDCTDCDDEYIEYFGECVKESDMACPRDHYIESFKADGSAVCNSCDASCGTCLGPESTDCVSCTDGYYFQGSHCVDECGAGKYKDNVLEQCYDCHTTCATCDRGSPSDCTSCDHDMQLSGPLHGYCRFGCPEGKYPIDGNSDTCGDCLDPSCSSCVGPEQGDCLTCTLGFMKTVAGECVTQCPERTYEYLLDDAVDGNECRDCHTSCQSCVGPGASKCSSCAGEMVLNNGQCLWDCEEGYYPDENGYCQRCSDTCQTCNGPHTKNCTSCRIGTILQQFVCVDECESGHFRMLDSVPTCRECDHTCSECSDYGPFDCTECYDNYKLEEGVCYNLCGDGHFFNKKTQTCGECSSECKECYGARADQCIDCHGDLLLEKIDRSHTRCIPCCTSASEGEECCEFCAADTSKCTNQYVHQGTTKEGVKVNHVGTIVFSCLVVVVLFFLVFGLLQARSHGKCCWSRRYTQVPSYSYNTKDKYVTLGKPTDDYYEEDIYGEVSDEDEEDMEEPDTFQTGGAAYRSVDHNGVIDHL